MCYLIYQDYTPPSLRGSTPPFSSSVPVLLDAGCLLLVVCSVLLLLLFGVVGCVGAEESLFVRIESSCIPSES